MHRMDGLPGFEGLLRVHRRLATKLTSDELRAIKEYIDDRVNQEQADLKFRHFSLQNDYDITVRKSSEKIKELFNELGEKKEIIKRYQSSDEKIITVYKQKEARWEKKQEMLQTEVDKLNRENLDVKTRLRETRDQLDDQSNRVKELESDLAVANESVKIVDEAKLAFKENKELKEDVLKMKMEADRKERLLQHKDAEVQSCRNEIEVYQKEKRINEHKVSTVQKDLQKHVKEVAEKCKKLSELQFQLQIEKRQEESLQIELRKATANLENYKKILEDGRKPLSESDQIVLTLRKDLDIMDIRLRALDITVRLKLDETKKIEDRIDELNAEERLANQIQSEVYLQGDTYLELTTSELIKTLSTKRKRLNEEFKYAKDWDYPKREADMLRAEITGLMKQASVCKLTELGSRAAKQLQKIEVIMRVSGETRMPKIFKVSERNNSDQRLHGSKKGKAFLSASTPINGFDSSFRIPSLNSNSRKKMSTNKGRQSKHVIENHTDDSKLNYVESTIDLDLSRLTPVSSPQYGNQSDRITLKSVSTARQGMVE